jgi:SAM-dependent methyltransferase
MAELRPDLHFSSVDLAGRPERTPPDTSFARSNLESDRLPWPDESFDAITCMHVVEHLHTMTNLWNEVARLLKRGGRVYIETPGMESLATASPPEPLRGKVTLNFFDDPTHVRPVPVTELAKAAADAGLRVDSRGRSRNWLFTAAYPVLCLFSRARKRYVAKLHWIGWSVYLIAEKPHA